MSELEEVRRMIQVAEADLQEAKAIKNIELLLKREERLNLLFRIELRLMTAGKDYTWCCR
jgi:hypothetical protein